MKKTEIVIGNQIKHLSKISRFFGELDSGMKEIQKNYEKNPEKLWKKNWKNPEKIWKIVKKFGKIMKKSGIIELCL